MREGNGGSLIPADMLVGAASSDAATAQRIAKRLLPAVRLASHSRDVSVHRISMGVDLCSIRIEVTGSPYYATITKHNVMEVYRVERTRRNASRRRSEVRPVLIEINHIFTVLDDEGALLSVSDAAPTNDVDAHAEAPTGLFGALFTAAKEALSPADQTVAGRV